MTAIVADNSARDERIGAAAKCFAIYLFLTWFQSSEQWGTIAAFATILLAIASAVFSGQVDLGRFRVTAPSACAFLLLVLVTGSALFVGNLAHELKLIAQIILFLCAANFCLNPREMEFIKRSFVLSSTIFAVMVIIGCTLSGAHRYYHGDITVLGTALNPNHAGLPLTAVSCLLYYSALNEGKRLVNLFLFGVNVVALILTASKASYLALAVTCLLITLGWLIDKRYSTFKKTLFAILLIVLFSVAVTLFQRYFPMQWDRMTSISLKDDNGRDELWSFALEGFEDSPLYGHGIGTMYLIRHRAAHNTFLGLLFELGLLGGATYLAFYTALFARQFKKRDKSLLFVLIAIGIKLLFMSALDNRTVWGILCWAAVRPGPPGSR